MFGILEASEKRNNIYVTKTVFSKGKALSSTEVVKL